MGPPLGSRRLQHGARGRQESAHLSGTHVLNMLTVVICTYVLHCNSTCYIIIQHNRTGSRTLFCLFISPRVEVDLNVHEPI